MLKKTFWMSVLGVFLAMQAVEGNAATLLCRSVGPETTAPLATGSGNPLSIAGSTASFFYDLPERVGVGDVIVYDSNGDSILDSRAFIESRTNGSLFFVKNSAGQMPTMTISPDEHWEVYRAYCSLSDAEQGAENLGIPTSLRNFDNAADGWDLVGGDFLLQLACYGDGPDTTPATFSGTAWTTDTLHYVRIFTPQNASEVGVSQRHNGKWDLLAYRMVTTDATCLDMQINYVRIEGLQFHVASVVGTARKCLYIETPGASDVRVSHTVFAGTITDQAGHAGITLVNAGSGSLYIWNNVFYDFDRSGANWTAAIELDDAEFEVHVLNNTMVGCYRGLYQNAGTVHVFNNLAQSCSDGYDGSFASDSDYNLSDLSADAPGVHAMNNSVVAFVNLALRDFHLATGDLTAKDHGTDLNSYSALSFSDDIDGEYRLTGSWDVGCDEEYPIPTATPTRTASLTPTLSPTLSPSVTASPTPSRSPTVTLSPTTSRSATPSPSPSMSRTPTPSPSPTYTPSPSPIFTPSLSPTNTPSAMATPSFTRTPTQSPVFSATPSSTVTPSPTTFPDQTASPTRTMVIQPESSRTTVIQQDEVTTVRISNNVIKSGGSQVMTIEVPLEVRQWVTIKIYSQHGTLVDVLADQEQDAGVLQTVWRGKNQAGSEVRSGVYLVYIKTEKIEMRKKVAVIR